MTAIFHATLADHYAELLTRCNSDEQWLIVKKALRYHENQYKKLNEYASNQNVYDAIQGIYEPDSMEKSFLISSWFKVNNGGLFQLSSFQKTNKFF